MGTNARGVRSNGARALVRPRRKRGPGRGADWGLGLGDWGLG
ncbi:hypothetical protein XHC_0315 [Xanthomonas hortorum pv. carotae str. M081]|nr:hypothetical protein XHC_0315 [Xanthomonas hortorum pv. carotae str. M081]